MKSSSPFNQDTFKFFSDLQKNNDREWFEKNKKRYENNVKKAGQDYVSAMNELFASIGLPFVADPKKALFRIYRDIRFSADKSPYKTHMGIYFPYTLDQTGKKPVNSVGLYVHVSPGECFIGGGIRTPDKDALYSIRNKIAENFDDFEAIVMEVRPGFNHFFVGEALKRAPKGFDPDHPAAEYIKLKDYTVWQDVDDEVFLQDQIFQLTREKAVAISPLLSFLNDAL